MQPLVAATCKQTHMLSDVLNPAACRRFTMPQAGPDKPWYSFDFGPIHFLQYSTEHVFAPGGCGQGVYRECFLSPEQIIECIAA